MLQLIRSKATSFVVKILFGLLIVTFGIWGVGDIFRNRGPDTSVATVGGRAITAEQLNQAVQSDMERLRGALGGSIDAQQAKQLGIVDQALQRLISGDLVELEINRLGLAIGDQATRDAIVGNAQFHDPSGQFDRNIYAQALAANHMTEAQFEALMRGDLLRAQLVVSLTSGMTPPAPLVDAIYRARAERRVADMVTVPPTAAGTIAAPSEEQIAEYYHAHEDRFRTPERRSFTVATLLVADVATGIDVPEDELKKQYDARSDEFHTPAQRHLDQMLLPDEATAQDAAAAPAAAGKDFAAVAKDVAKTDDPASLDLGWVSEKDLPPELGAPAFALPVGGTTPPIKSTFGWHIMRVVEEKPASVQTFDQVKDKLKTEIARERAGDRAADIANQVDDAIAGGGSFDDVAQKFTLKTVPVTAADADGKLPDGKEATLPEPRETILHTAFATDSGQTSALSELGDDGYYLVRVDKVAPAATRSLADVHDAAAAAWQEGERQAAAQKIADQMAAEINGGKSLKDVAGEHHLAVAPTPPLLRNGGDDKVPPALVAKLFDAKQGAAVTEAAADGVVVAQLTSVVPADPATDQTTVKQLSQQLGTALAGDVAAEYEQALRRHYPVAVDQSSLDRLF